jgi:hypothetical protein
MRTTVTTFIFACALMLSGPAAFPQASSELTGAWRTNTKDGEIVMICTGKYFSAAVFNPSTGAFVGTCGGTYEVSGNTFTEFHEFNTMKPELIGRETKSPLEIKSGKLLFTENDVKVEWTRIDNGKPGVLAGAWLITGRMEGESMSKITPSARRTMKILSGTRFQWIAYNVETKEFFGTGGGTYITENGKYKENIGFFSRDNSRVGKSLEFDFSFQEGNWRHKGLSSKGDPIDEIWTKREKIGL